MMTTRAQRSPLLQELKQVHDMLRQDLASCRRLAAAATNGATDSELREGVTQLQTRSLLFQLRTNCLSYCQMVHNHHRREDIGLFPAVRRSAPHLHAQIDQLESDHRVVSMLLDAVETAAQTLHGNATEARTQLSEALSRLSDDLLQHLDLEEQTLDPVLSSWDAWPTE